jgi:ABC-type antimicrobial peptide transport system permease subunit
MAYRVARRTREIGIRIAVGASRPSVVWMMVRETLLLVAAGASLGTLAIAVALPVLGIVTMVAAYVPARQASRIDPVRALRAE